MLGSGTPHQVAACMYLNGKILYACYVGLSCPHDNDVGDTAWNEYQLALKKADGIEELRMKLM